MRLWRGTIVGRRCRRGLLRVECGQRRTHGTQTGAVALGHAVQHVVTLLLFDKTVGDVLQQQHEATERWHRVGPCGPRGAAAFCGQHRRHLYAQQAPLLGVGHELASGIDRRTLQALLHAVQGMVQQRAIEQTVHRAANAHGPRPPLRPGQVVAQQDAPIQVAHQDRLLQLGQQGGQMLFFLLHAAAGTTHFFLHVAL